MIFGIIYDVIVVLIVVLATIAAVKKGFAYTLVNFAGYIVSLFAAFILSKPIANTICQKLIAPVVSDKLTQSIQSAGNDIAAGVDSYVQTLPDFAKGLFSFADYSTASGADVAGTVASISDNVIMPVIVNIVSILLFVILFSVFLFIVHKVADITKFVKHVPLIGFVNKILGAVMGVLKGLILAYLFFCVISLLSVWLGASVSFLSPGAVASSYTFGIMESIGIS